MSKEQFWTHVEKTPTCWIWTGSKRGAYGWARVSGHSSHAAHRIAYELLVGPISEGLELDHLCRNPPCVNPAHLEAVTHRENMARGNALWVQRAKATACVHGHPFTEANTIIKADGHRKCRTCHNQQTSRKNTRDRHERGARRYTVRSESVGL